MLGEPMSRAVSHLSMAGPDQHRADRVVSAPENSS
jgi:hypothetical protein